MADSTLIGCDLFCGAGGMSLGAEMAGIKVRVAVENDKYAAETFRKNHPQTTLIADDIRNIDPIKYFKTAPFIIFGGPPCQGFSLSNTVTRNLENKHNSLFEEFLRFIEILEPQWCVFENVEGFVSFQKGMIAAALKERLEKLGYSVTSGILNASAYGVPQDRNRFFMVGNKAGKSFKFPMPQKVRFTVKDALADLPSLRNGDSYEALPYKKEPENKFALRMRKGSKEAKQNFVSRNKEYVIERYKYIKPGQNWKAIPERLMKNYKNREQCHSGIYKRLNPEKASVVISNFRKNMLIHPFEDRGLSLREAARLQSFPDKFIFCGPLMYMQQQIGNAVPPLLSKVVA
ncbi:MAG TPA: DNA cytosine methyltransferase [Chitinophagales bacterium]|nr:DNA cytosine methyltransferase [Chitinophagales bacterium]